MRFITILTLVSVVAGCSLPDCYNSLSVMPLPKNEVPQFILISHDDELNKETHDAFEKFAICNSKITFFVMWAEIDCRFVRAYFYAGHEIALHTVNHLHLTGVPLDRLEYEMLGVRDLIHKKCGIPFESMTGFRAPFLDVNEHTRRVLNKDRKILYESSYNSDYNMAPFTMDNGPFKNSSMAESYPGFWQVPLNSVQNKVHKAAYTMDPGRISQTIHEFPFDIPGEFIPASSMFDLLVQNFDDNRNGNRIPFSVNFHTPWMQVDGYASAFSDFLEYTREFDDVYYVTYTELIEWMKKPIPLSQMPKQSSTCIPIIVAPKTFWEQWGTVILVAAIVAGPVFTLTIGMLIAQIFFLIILKNPA